MFGGLQVLRFLGLLTVTFSAGVAWSQDDPAARVAVLERKLVCCGALTPLHRDLHGLSRAAGDASGDFEAAQALLDLRVQIDLGLDQLDACVVEGEPAWQAFRDGWRRLTQGIPNSSEFEVAFEKRDAIESVALTLPLFSADLALASQALLSSTAGAAEAAAIGRLQQGAEVVQRQLATLEAGGAKAVTATDQLTRLAVLVPALLDGLIEGGASGVPQITDAATVDALSTARQRWRSLAPQLEVVMDSGELLELVEAMDRLQLELDELRADRLKAVARSQSFCGLPGR